MRRWLFEKNDLNHWHDDILLLIKEAQLSMSYSRTNTFRDYNIDWLDISLDEWLDRYEKNL